MVSRATGYLGVGALWENPEAKSNTELYNFQLPEPVPLSEIEVWYCYVDMIGNAYNIGLFKRIKANTKRFSRAQIASAPFALPQTVFKFAVLYKFHRTSTPPDQSEGLPMPQTTTRNHLQLLTGNYKNQSKHTCL
jgi:hypothetical protein